MGEKKDLFLSEEGQDILVIPSCCLFDDAVSQGSWISAFGEEGLDGIDVVVLGGEEERKVVSTVNVGAVGEEQEGDFGMSLLGGDDEGVVEGLLGEGFGGG